MRAWGRALPVLGLVLLAAPESVAGSRARYGGTLRVALGQKRLPLEPLLADAPEEASVLALWAQSVCRLDAAGEARPVLAKASFPSPTRLRLTLRPAVSFDGGRPLGPRELLESLRRALGSPSPYGALLEPARLDEASLQADALELPLAFAWPDLVRSLCHPSLAVLSQHGGRAVGVGPFSANSSPLRANLGFPLGRPFVDALELVASDPRTASRQLATGKVELALGGVSSPPKQAARALYATYLAYESSRVGEPFREAIESRLDRTELARYFAQAPAVPMSRLLPPSLDPREPAKQPPKAPAASSPKPMTLLFDADRSDQRAVAGRLQVKLHDAGYRVSLQGLTRDKLRERASRRDFDLLLDTFLLPPSPAPALAVLLAASGHRPWIAARLSPLGSELDAAARDERARALADELSASVELIPLFAQSLRSSATPRLLGLSFDAQGLPELDGISLEGD